MKKRLTLIGIGCALILAYIAYTQSVSGYKPPAEVAESAYTMIGRTHIKNDMLRSYTENKSFLARFNDYRRAASSSGTVLISFEDDSQLFFDVNLVIDSSAWFPSIQFEAEKIVDSHNNTVRFDEFGSPKLRNQYRFPENSDSMPVFIAAADLVGADITAHTCQAGVCTLTIGN